MPTPLIKPSSETHNVSKATVHAYKTKKVLEKDEEWKNQDNMNNLLICGGLKPRHTLAWQVISV